MKYFSVPADFKKETIDAYEKLNNTYKDAKVIETYGNISVDNFLESGRAASHIPPVGFPGLCDYVQYSRKKNIRFNYTLNASYMHNKEFTVEGMVEIKRFLKRLYDIGVRSLTVSLPSLIEIVKSTGYDFEIKASVICQITSANKALGFKEMGVERILVDETVTRDFKTIRNIRNAFGENVEIIVNSLCLMACKYRMFHYNQLCGDSTGDSNPVSVNYFEHRCLLQRYGKIDNFLKLAWIRPEDIKYYMNAGINYFKLQGRQTVLKGDPVRTLECYFKESHDGNLLDLLNMFALMNRFDIFVDNKKLEGFIKPFYEKDNFCASNCMECNYCKSFVKKCIDCEKAKETMDLAVEFYSGYDSFNELKKNTEPAEEPGESTIETLVPKSSILEKDQGDFVF
jgi:collagenase-like PrtC family protease